MSFGYSVGDIITVTTLAWNAVQHTRQACGQYDELTREVTSLHIVLNRLQAEAAKPDTLLIQLLDNEKQELAHIVNGCGEVLKVLSVILEKYGALGGENNSVTKLWQRIRFGTGEMLDLSQIRMQLSSQTASLALFLHLLSLGSQGRVERQMAEQMGALNQIRQTIELTTSGVVVEGNRASILTTYENDDKDFWKEFRRELIAGGCSSDVMAKHKDIIMTYIKELSSKGDFSVEEELLSGVSQPLNQLQPEVASMGSFNFDDEAVNSRIYTRIMASASVRNSRSSMPANLARISELHDWPLHEINDHTPGQFESQVIENAILAQRCLAINRKLERNGNVLPSSEVNIYPPRQPLASNKRKPSDNRDKSPENSPELAKKHSYKGVREYKLVVIGGGGVDKSSFAIQLIQSHFVDEYDPTILDSYKRLCVIDEKEAILDVLDTAGQEEYSAMREQYMRTGEGFLLIYSITSRRSFEEILSFQQQILRVKDLDYFPIIIVANHCDREDERQVSRQEGEALACSFGCQFIEASAKARINVEDSFYSIVREIRRYETEMKEYEKRKEVEIVPKAPGWWPQRLFSAKSKV